MLNAGANGLAAVHEREKAKLYACELSGLKDDVISQLQAIGQDKENRVSAILENHMFAQDRDGKSWMRPACEWAHDAKAEIAEYLNGNKAMADDIVIATIVETYAGQMLGTLRDIERFSKRNKGAEARIYGPKIDAKERELKYMGTQLVEDMESVAGISRITMGNAVDEYMDGMKAALRDVRAQEHVPAR